MTIQKLYVVVAASCRDCGPRYAVGLFTSESDEKQKAQVADRIGGMFCIETYTSEIEIDGPARRIDKWALN